MLRCHICAHVVGCYSPHPLSAFGMNYLPYYPDEIVGFELHQVDRVMGKAIPETIRERHDAGNLCSQAFPYLKSYMALHGVSNRMHLFRQCRVRTGVPKHAHEMTKKEEMKCLQPRWELFQQSLGNSWGKLQETWVKMAGLEREPRTSQIRAIQAANSRRMGLSLTTKKGILSPHSLHSLYFLCHIQTLCKLVNYVASFFKK